MPTSQPAAGKKKLLVFETAKRHAGIWRDAHDFLIENLSFSLLYGAAHARAFRLCDLTDRLDDFIADTERDKYRSPATYNTALAYLYVLAGMMQYQIVALYLDNGGWSPVAEGRTAAALQKAIDHFTSALNFASCPAIVRHKSQGYQRYGRLICTIALADLYALAIKCRVWLRRQDQPCFAEDIFDRFSRYAERALAETKDFDRDKDIEARLRISALGLCRLGLTPEKRESSGKEIGELIHAASYGEEKIRRLLGEEFSENRFWFLWRLTLSFYQDVERPDRIIAETEGGGWFFLMPEIPASDRAAFEMHRRTLRENWKAANERWSGCSESWRDYVCNFSLIDKLILRADTLQSSTLRLYASLLDVFYHYDSARDDRNFDQTYWAAMPAKAALDGIDEAAVNEEAKQILRVNLTALQAAILIERIDLLPGAIYTFRYERHAKLYTETTRRADAKTCLAEARQRIKSISKTDLESLPLRQRWFFHQTAAALYSRMPQTGIIKRAAAHHKRLATRGRNAAAGKTSGDVLVDDFLGFLARGAGAHCPQ